MRIHGAHSRNFSTHSLFAAFCLGLIGWGLMHIWGVSVKTGALFHALAAIPGLVLSCVIFYRYRQHWPANEQGNPGLQNRSIKLSWDYRAIIFCLLLVGIGCGIGLFIGGGSLFLLVLASLGMVLVPWARIAVCRDHFFFSSALVEAGTLLGLVLPAKPVHPLYYPIAAWLLLSVSCVMVSVAILVHGNRLDRMPVSGY